jgi:hypothetical protein
MFEKKYAKPCKSRKIDAKLQTDLTQTELQGKNRKPSFLFRHKSPEFIFEIRQILFNNSPYERTIDFEVAMDENIAHADDIVPWDFRVFILNSPDSLEAASPINWM